MAAEENSWRTDTFRQSMVAKIEEAIQTAGVPLAKNSNDLENHVYMKAKSKEDYLGYVARLILHIREINSKKNPGNAAGGGNPGMPDPIGALQTLARQGTGNNQIVNMPVPGSAAQGMIPQAPPNTAANLLQSLNQRPNQQINMAGMGNKMPTIGMMQNQAGGPIGHMGNMPMQNTAMINQIGQQINQIGQPNMPQQMAQIQMPPNSMAQMTNAQIQQPPIQQNMQNQITNTMQSQLQNQLGNQMANPMATQMAAGAMNASMQAGVQQQAIAQMNNPQMAPNQMPQQIAHIQRKPNEIPNAAFSGLRNVAPNQFLRENPSPSAPSPSGLGAPPSNQMVSSPALAPSPSSQHVMLGGPPRTVNMAPSPSGSLNTPGATHSPMQDDQACKDKILKLSKYIEPLKKAIREKSGESEGSLDRSRKMKMLLDILLNPTKRVWSIEMLMKCEKSLENYFKRGDSSIPPITTLKENYFFSPLLEAVSTHLQSPVANHTLQRTFGPCLEALFGPEIKNTPPPLKKQKVEETSSDIPDVLQGEIARLDQRFKVSLDPAQQSGSQCIQLICWLDDRHLPCVPPVSVTVPADYPQTPPLCIMASHEYATPFLSAVQKALNARITKLPKRFSVSQLLDTWEMSVRQASAPVQSSVAANSVLLGL